jgi:hypothetical protein
MSIMREQKNWPASDVESSTERKDEVFSHARPEPSGAYEPEISISIRM